MNWTDTEMKPHYGRQGIGDRMKQKTIAFAHVDDGTDACVCPMLCIAIRCK